jgi:hypothetical protein
MSTSSSKFSKIVKGNVEYSTQGDHLSKKVTHFFNTGAFIKRTCRETTDVIDFNKEIV